MFYINFRHVIDQFFTLISSSFLLHIPKTDLSYSTANHKHIYQ